MIPGPSRGTSLCGGVFNAYPRPDESRYSVERLTNGMPSTHLVDLRTLDSGEQALLGAAQSVMSRAYNLYSGFYVGAAVSTASGGTFSGANVENASFGLTICAEPAAILRAYADGDVDIRAIAVVGGPSPGSAGEIVTPCGRCRQMIYEAAQVSGTDIAVLCSNADLSRVMKVRISDLLPFPFGPTQLNLQDKIDEFVGRARSRR
jgi:cytidine deaminase